MLRRLLTAVSIVFLGSTIFAIPSLGARASVFESRLSFSERLLHKWQVGVEVRPLLQREESSVVLLYSFKGAGDGAYPSSGLVLSKGSLYGTTYLGGSFGNCFGSVGPIRCGTVFGIQPRGQGYSSLDFQGGSDGSNPVAPLIADAQGNLYGTTTGDDGTASTFEVTSGSIVGFTPAFSGSLLLKSGVLYGTSSSGGQGGCGIAGKFTHTGNGWTETDLYDFQGGSDGCTPNGGLIADKQGALYGTTSGGGTTGYGTVFKLTPATGGYSETILYTFHGGKDGATPNASLLLDTNGALYGTTQYGGGSTNCSGGCGTAFRLTPTNSGYAETYLYRFKSGNDGADPTGGLIADKNGVLYGTTDFGGSTTYGTLFKLTPSGPGYKENILYTFLGGKTDGLGPVGALTAYKGALYGVTIQGGNSKQGNCYLGCGTLFKFTP